ncbi:MAG: DegT/DnrJ/EryC1/StrS family aminotransferase [Candidatus Binatia bacterium]
MIPFLDLAGDFAAVEAEARRRLDGVLARQQFVLGPETAELEDSLRRRLGAGGAVAVSSGSEALVLSLLSLGIGAGDAVLLPAFTFFATAGAVLRTGAVPVFCDIDRGTFLAGGAEMRAAVDGEFRADGGVHRHRRSGARLAALLPVHLYGRAAAMPEIVALAAELGVKVVEDAAQAVDCRLGGGSVGLFGDAGCLSFYPTKNLGGGGDGGMILCGDPAAAARLARLRSHGSEPGSYEHLEAGVNARMGELVAAVLNAKLPRLEAWTRHRRAVAALYGERLAEAATGGLLELPDIPEAADSHVWHQYAVRLTGAGRRDRVAAALERRGMATRVFYPLPLHLQPCFAGLGGKEGDLPCSEAAAREVLCLPIHGSIAVEAAATVAEALAEEAGAAAS